MSASLMPEPSEVEDDWLTPREASALTRAAEKTLANWRALSVGPPYTKLSEGKSGRVRYRRRDLVAWLDQRRVA